MLRRTDAILLTLLIVSINGLFGCTDKQTTASKSTSKQKKKDAPKKSPDSSVPQINQEERDAENAKKIEEATRIVKSLRYAVEAYNTDVGFYPRDLKNCPGADIPDMLFIGLNNKPTALLGGGPNSPYFEHPAIKIGLKKADGNFVTLDPKLVNKTEFQKAHPPRKVKEIKELGDLRDSKLTEKLLYLDPWERPYHYREWSSKSSKLKKKWNEQKQAKTTVHNGQYFDIWSNGPDGVNNYGAKGSDDIKNWKD